MLDPTGVSSVQSGETPTLQRMNSRLLRASGLRVRSSLLLGDPGRDSLVEDIERQGAAVEDLVVEGADVVAWAEFFLG